MINQLAGPTTRSENAYFANNEQASIAVMFFTCRTSFN